ncbi:MAG: 30S ribosomal protein S8 [Candidatus Abyssobacteria bacterium SURF_17]|jgi:small subunit ribosomal protein S8|uniref:Small ribosomal subunit protein uS8 n=1 Tax=Candidatus Abyssobacteria bacterium SURF_17 TaxID=2093361 RepID=A0A419EVK8_9BACT|nr:MAG: 30S ribosomal protein S8 [Candidatus Abyssubacteria bacterium SURF_17]
MSLSDPIADMLVRIRNANVAKNEKVDIPSSKMNEDIARILKREGYVTDYKVIENRKQGILRVFMKYGPGEERVIRGLRRVSKPGRRVYRGAKELPRVMGGLGVSLVSTPKGVLTDKQSREANLGGEIICEVW